MGVRLHEAALSFHSRAPPDKAVQARPPDTRRRPRAGKAGALLLKLVRSTKGPRTPGVGGPQAHERAHGVLRPPKADGSSVTRAALICHICAACTGREPHKPALPGATDCAWVRAAHLAHRFSKSAARPQTLDPVGLRPTVASCACAQMLPALALRARCARPSAPLQRTIQHG